MTETDKNNLFQAISADFKIINRKTNLWKMDLCEQILHDIEMLLKNEYLSKVHLIMKDFNNKAIRTNKYEINYNIRINQNDRLGNNDWDNLEGNELIVVLSYTDLWRNLQELDKSEFKNKLKIQWTISNENLDFLHLKKHLSKKYSASNSLILRTDYK